MNKIEYLNQKYELKEKTNIFRFTCDKCGECCGNDITIMINPYDIIRICKNQNITTTELINKYCYIYIGKDSKFPILALNTNPICMFNISRLCSIYEDRPLRCRMYPIGRATRCNIKTNANEEKFFVEKNCSKIPLRLQKLQTIKNWLDNHDVNIYLKKCSEWNEILIRWVEMEMPEMNIVKNALIQIAYDFDNSKTINGIDDIDEKYDYILKSLNQFLDACEKNKGVEKDGI